MLAAATEQSGEFDSASVAVVAVSDDQHAISAVEGVTSAMTDPRRYTLVTLERVVAEAARIPLLASWAEAFHRRYLDLSPVR